MKKSGARKIVGILLMLAAIAAMLTACGSKFTCDICLEEKTGKRYESDLFGETITVCKDCYEELTNAIGF